LVSHIGISVLCIAYNDSFSSVQPVTLNVTHLACSFACRSAWRKWWISSRRNRYR